MKDKVYSFSYRDCLGGLTARFLAAIHGYIAALRPLGRCDRGDFQRTVLHGDVIRILFATQEVSFIVFWSIVVSIAVAQRYGNKLIALHVLRNNKGGIGFQYIAVTSGDIFRGNGGFISVAAPTVCGTARWDAVASRSIHIHNADTRYGIGSCSRLRILDVDNHLGCLVVERQVVGSFGGGIENDARCRSVEEVALMVAVAALVSLHQPCSR